MEKNPIKLGLACWVLVGFAVAMFAAIILIFSPSLPKQIPLWYSRPWGDLQLAAPIYLAVIPLLMAAIAYITNFALCRIKKGFIWQKVSGWSGVIAETILVLAMLRIWMLVI